LATSKVTKSHHLSKNPKLITLRYYFMQFNMPVNDSKT